MITSDIIRCVVSETMQEATRPPQTSVRARSPSMQHSLVTATSSLILRVGQIDDQQMELRLKV